MPLPCACLSKPQVLLYLSSSLYLPLPVPAASLLQGKAVQKPAPLKPEIFPSAA